MSAWVKSWPARNGSSQTPRRSVWTRSTLISMPHSMGPVDSWNAVPDPGYRIRAKFLPSNHRLTPSAGIPRVRIDPMEALDGTIPTAQAAEMVGVRGFEPPTSATRTQRSTRLSHTPTAGKVGPSAARVNAPDPEPARTLVLYSPRSTKMPPFWKAKRSMKVFWNSPMAMQWMTTLRRPLALRTSSRMRSVST